MPTIIAFFKLSDFIREVKGSAQPGVQPVVRVEGLTKTNTVARSCRRCSC